MKKAFTIDKKPLLSILASMQPLCTKRTTIDATSSILFQVGQKELVLKSTDLEVSLQASCTLENSSLVDAESFLVSGKRIFDLVKELDGVVQCELDGGTLSLESQGVHLTLNIKSAEEFPPFPERIENLMSIRARDLLSMLERVAFLIPQNNSNPSLNGLYLEVSSDSFTMTSTDGHCLAQVKSQSYTLETTHTWLLPRRAVFELKKLIESSCDECIFLGLCDSQLVVSGELFNFFTRLLASPFPEYRPILQRDAFVPAHVDRGQFIKTLRRTACLLSGQFLATQFNFNSEHIHVTLHNKEVGSLDEHLPIKEGSAELGIRFYSPYLLSGLQQAFSGDKVTFFLKNSSRPIIFESQDEQITMTYLVMPVSQQNQSA